ncbi:hypothetical protein H8E77_08635 [bacterium]|nr:hypothetical protein [bacterium]
MAESVFALPVNLEQIAALIKRMSPDDRQRLLKLVPELRQEAVRPVLERSEGLCSNAVKQTKRTLDDARKTVKQLQQEVLQTLSGQLLSPDEPFLEGLTLGEYLDLPEAEQSKLWDKWAFLSLEELEEVEVRPDAVPAR